MSTIDVANGAVDLVILYWGPDRSGKTASLEALAGRLPRDATSGLARDGGDAEGAPPHEVLPIDLGDVDGVRVRVLLRAVPGGPSGRATRRRLLPGVDGVVFVADVASDRLRANAESLRELREGLTEEGVRLAELPLVLQANGGDRPGALPADMVRQVLDPEEARPVVEAVAPRSEGVADALREAARRVLERLAAPA